MTPADLAAIKARVEADDYSSYALVDNVLALVAEVERLRDALAGAKIEHDNWGGSDHDCHKAYLAYKDNTPEAIARYIAEPCTCGADAHNAAIDKALRGEA